MKPGHLTEFVIMQLQAERVLTLFRQRFGFPNGPPVPIEMIAQSLFGLRRESANFGDWDACVAAALTVDNRTIYLREGLQWHQRLFALAHEVAHLVLHEGGLASELRCDATPHIPLNHLLRSARSREQEEKVKLREIEANQFAAALLVPRSLIIPEVSDYQVMDAEAIYELAQRFHVSTPAMLRRIEDLSGHLAWMGPPVSWRSFHCLRDSLDRSGYREPKNRYPFLRPSGLVPIGSVTSKPEILPEVSSLVGDYLRRHRLRQSVTGGARKPLIVELAGTPNSGKDTLIAMIRTYLEDICGHRVRVFDEGVKSCHPYEELEKELDLDRLCKATALAVLQLYEAISENPGGHDFVIFNRGVFDLLAWLRIARICGRISRKQEVVHRNYLLSYSHLLDITFLFLTSAEDSIRREEEETMRRLVVKFAAERRQKGTPWQRTLHSKEMLTVVNASYRHIYHAYQGDFPLICLFDFVNWSDAENLEEGLDGKFRAVVDAISPRNGTQLPFPQMFGVHYLTGKSSDNRRPIRVRYSKPRDRMTTQLPLFAM